MDDKTYRRLFVLGQCSCGFKPRSTQAEAYHRHNFPLLCRKPKGKKSVKVDECLKDTTPKGDR